MTDLGILLKKSASDIGRALVEGQTNPVELCAFALEAIASFEDQSIFLSLSPGRAKAEAEASAQRLTKGVALSAFDGVPIAYKDLIDVKGEITSAGSAVYRHGPPAQADAQIVANASAAGMVTIGKLNLTEFAYSGLGLNPHFGTPQNPCLKGQARVPGGSSSGSGVVVAAGLLPVAIGTDTGGSVRIPAAFNGIVGYKSSEGRITTKGVFPLSKTLDTLGPLACSVEDCIKMERILRGQATGAIRQSSLHGVRFIVPQTIVLDDLDEAVAANFEASLVQLERAGAVVVRSKLEIFDQVVRLADEFGTIPMAEAYAFHRELIEAGKAPLVDHRVMKRILGGKDMSQSGLEHLHSERARLRAELGELVGDGFVVMPTTAMTAPEIAPLEADDELFHRTNLKALRNTSLGNFLNMPGLALPNGADHCGMPTSILISTTQGRDEHLLGVGLGAEKILGGDAAGN